MRREAREAIAPSVEAVEIVEIAEVVEAPVPAAEEEAALTPTEARKVRAPPSLLPLLFVGSRYLVAPPGAPCSPHVDPYNGP